MDRPFEFCHHLPQFSQEQGKHFSTAQGRGSFQGVLLDFLVAESAVEVAVLLPIDQLPVLGILSRPSKDLPLLGFGGISCGWELCARPHCCLVCIVVWALEACAYQHRLNPLKGLHFSLWPGGSSLAIEQWTAKRMSCSVPALHQRFTISWI
jgi:hypothetical protein